MEAQERMGVSAVTLLVGCQEAHLANRKAASHIPRSSLPEQLKEDH